MRRYLVILLVAAAATVVVSARAFAHHSFAATYAEDQRVTIEGELVQFLFKNPHSFVHVAVKDENGSTVRYAVEWGGAGQLGFDGVTEKSLKPGDKVIISGSPGHYPGDHRLRMTSLLRPRDGFGWSLSAHAAAN